MGSSDFLSADPKDRVRLVAGAQCEYLPGRSTVIAAAGRAGPQRVIALATDPAVDRGALGLAEAADIKKTLALAKTQRVPLVLIIDSAGARVSEGVAIQGALRILFSHLIDACFAGVHVIAILGRNVFGGASMLAMAARQRLYCQDTRLAMTGPAVIRAQNSVSIERVNHTIGAKNRRRYDKNAILIVKPHDACIKTALQQCFDARYESFESYLADQKQTLAARAGASEDAEKSADSVCFAPGRITLTKPISAGPSALMRAAGAFETLGDDVAAATIRCQWRGHSMAVADEDKLLSQYLTYLCCVMRGKQLTGTHLGLHIAAPLSGGLYIALAAGSSRVTLGQTGGVATLPPDVLAVFIDKPPEPPADIGTLMACHVVDGTNTK